MNGRGPEDFWGGENTLINTVVVDICHYIFVKTHSPTMDLLIKTCQCRFIDCDKCNTLVVVGSGGYAHMGGGGHLGTFCSILL